MVRQIAAIALLILTAKSAFFPAAHSVDLKNSHPQILVSGVSLR